MEKWNSIRGLLRELRAEIRHADQKMFEIFCIAFGGVGMFMCMLNIASHSYLVAALTCGIGLWMMATWFVFRKGKHINIGILGIFALMATIMLYFVIDGGEEGFSFVWLFLVPPVSGAPCRNVFLYLILRWNFQSGSLLLCSSLYVDTPA